MPKELKHYMRRELDAMTWGEVQSLGRQLDIRPQKGLLRPGFTDLVEAGLNTRFGLTPDTLVPAKPMFDTSAWFQNAKAAPAIPAGSSRHVHIAEPQKQDDYLTPDAGPTDMPSVTDGAAEEWEREAEISRQERLAELRGQEDFFSQHVPITKEDYDAAPDDPNANPWLRGHSFDPTGVPNPHFQILKEAGHPVIKFGIPAGVSSGYDAIPDATERVALPATMQIGLEDLKLCLQAMGNASRQATEWLRTAEWVGGNIIKLSIPQEDGGHKRVLITLPGCVTVQAEPCD